MNSAKAAHLALLAVLLLAAAQIGYHWRHLPPRVPSHFNLRGDPDDWMAKKPYVFIQAGLLLGMAGLQALLDLLIRRSPPGAFNLPNRNYWLAPERRAETKEIISAYMAWLFVAALLFFTVMFELGYQVNVGHPHAMRQGMPWLLAAFAGFALVWLVRFYRRFFRPPWAD
jgi:uncharacterized membrane protein